MNKIVCLICYQLIFSAICLKSQALKSIVYDFDGFDLNQSSLPEGDYGYGDIAYKISSPPFPTNSPMLGDRCLEIKLNWNQNYAAFGRGISRFLLLDPSKDYLNFYLLNANSQAITLELIIGEDDNQNGVFESSGDDSWRRSVSVPASQSWQLISIPLSQFSDSNAGGNGVMDIGFAASQGMLLLCEFKFLKSTSSDPQTLLLDMICFSEQALKTGTDILSFPSPAEKDYCRIGAFSNVAGDNYTGIPQEIESFFSPTKKIKYVNTFIQWSQNSLNFPNTLPGSGIQQLIDRGYQPILTWEPLYRSLPPLDPQQPNLQQIITGNFDTYLDAFGDELKNYSDTVIIRLMHEFDGNWYPWCIANNGQDPVVFATAFQYIVTRIRNRGANKIKWLWCPNSDYAPYQNYNWMVNAYPGDSFVDYTGTDIYNGHYPSLIPWWRSFRWIATESCYYLHNYFPSKPILICELGCRERTTSEALSSQSKATWFYEMNRQLQGQFSMVRGLIFFNASTGLNQNWKINSSPESLANLQTYIWNDSYYFPEELALSTQEQSASNKKYPFPNPAKSAVFLNADKLKNWYLRTNDGRQILDGTTESLSTEGLSQGYYILEIKTEQYSRSYPLLIEK